MLIMDVKEHNTTSVKKKYMIDVKTPLKAKGKKPACCYVDPPFILTGSIAADLWLHCFSYLNIDNLCTVIVVNKDWHAILMTSPFFWIECYVRTFRQSTPQHMSDSIIINKSISCKDIKSICFIRHQKNKRVQVNSLCTWWIRSAPESLVVFHDAYTTTGDIALCIIEEPLLKPFAFGTYLYTRQVIYFEITLLHGCHRQVSIGITKLMNNHHTNNNATNNMTSHVGWYPWSYGLHSDDGFVHYNNDNSHGQFGVHSLPYGSSFHQHPHHHQASIIGCGLDLDRDILFFTYQGQKGKSIKIHGRCDAPVIASIGLQDLGDTVVFNFGQQPFVYDLEEYVASRNDDTA